MNDEAPRALRIELSPRTLIYILLIIAGVWLAVRLWTVFVVLLVALVLVGTFDPLVGWLERRGLGRGRALALIFFATALALAAILLVTIPPLVAQLQHILENLPQERSKAIRFLNQYQLGAPFVKTIRAIPLDSIVLRAGDALLGYSAQILTALGYAVTTIFLALYLLAEPRRAQGALYALVPRHHHVKLAQILRGLKQIVGGYMRGQLITSISIAVFTFGLLTAFKVEDALALAMFAGLTDVIPFIGGYVASAPVIISVAARGTASMLIVAAAMVLYQEFESRILVPRVYGRALRLSPALVLVALLTGGTLLGMLGALLALPVAAGVTMIVRELRVELPGEGPQTEAMRARDERVGAIYEQLTEHAPVEQAVAIAGQLADTIAASELAGTRVSAELAALEQQERDKSGEGPARSTAAGGAKVIDKNR
ncbi:MAG: AI-2E family transporter [Kofleriaceae bacterium]